MKDYKQSKLRSIYSLHEIMGFDWGQPPAGMAGHTKRSAVAVGSALTLWGRALNMP